MDFIAFVCYLVSSGGYFIFVYKKNPSLYKIASGFTLLGLLFHGVGLVPKMSQWLRDGSIGSSHSLVLVAFLIVVVFLLLLRSSQIQVIGVIIMPLASVLMLGVAFFPSGIVHENPFLKNGIVLAHVAAMFIAYSLFAVTFALSLLYLFWERAIKRKMIIKTPVALFPSLESLDKLSHICVMIGFPFMTFGLIAGFVSARLFWSISWSGDPKEVFSLMTWFIYAILFHERLAVGWRGRKAAWLSIAGFGGVVMTFLGVSLIFNSHHSVFFFGR